MKEMLITYDNDRNKIVEGGSWVSTDSLNLAEVLNYKHDEILRRIRNILKDYKIEYSEFKYESSKVQEFIFNNTDFKFEECFYRNTQNKLQPYYKLSKDLLVLVIFSFRKLQNAQELQKAYIAKFNSMEKELHWWRARYLGIITRNKFTEAIKDCVEGATTKTYVQYTDLVYETLFGKKAWEIRKEYGIKSQTNVRPYMDEESTILVDLFEKEIETFITYGVIIEELKEKVKFKYPSPFELKMNMKKVNKHIERQKNKKLKQEEK
jgi:Rha family phage regulatory protein